MKVTDLIVEVRNSSLARVGQILPTDLVGFTAVLRFCKVGTWEIPLHATNAMADALRAPGAGIVVTGPNGVLFSGPTTGATKSQTQDNPLGEWTIRGVTDEVILGERLAYPTPATADVSLQTDDFDTRTGVASAIMYAYVDANIGTSAPAARKISALTLAADPAVGSTITGNARFQTLGSLLGSLATFNVLGFTIKQSGSNLQFAVYQPTDRSAYIRMDVDNDMLVKSEYTYQAPEATRVIVAGQGVGSTRTFLERSSSASTTAETAWGRRIEVFKDQRSSSATADLQQAGDEILTDKGKTLEAISVSPSDDSTMAYGIDWGLGDKVSVVAGSTTIAQIVTEVGIKVDADGVRIGATVGEPAVADDGSTVAEVQADQEERITNLEVNTAASSSVTLNGSSVTLGGSGTVYNSPNCIINGAMEINQRSFTSTTTNAIFMHDRWRTLRTQTANGSVTYTVGTLAPGDVSSPLPQGYITVASSGQTLTDSRSCVLQRIEDVRTLAGLTVTVSFWAKAASGTPSMAVSFDQSFGTGGSPLVGTFFGKVTLSTTWTRYSVTGTIPSVAGKTITADSVGTALILWTSAGSNYNAGTGSLGFQNATISFTGVQVEEGTVATPFRRNANSIQAELAACQRYYWRTYGDPTTGYAVVAQGAINSSGNAAGFTVFNPVTMRATPTSIDYSTSLFISDNANNLLSNPTLTMDANYKSPRSFSINTSSLSGTAFRPANLNTFANTAYFGANAEL